MFVSSPKTLLFFAFLHVALYLCVSTHFFLSNLLCFFSFPVHYHFAHCNFVQRNAFGNNTKPVIVEKMPSNTLKKIQSMSHRKIGMIQRKQNKQIQIKTEINLKNANVPQSKQDAFRHSILELSLEDLKYLGNNPFTVWWYFFIEIFDSSD